MDGDDGRPMKRILDEIETGLLRPKIPRMMIMIMIMIMRMQMQTTTDSPNPMI
jgi:hypothetical protein